jgi:hypothetical protein
MHALLPMALFATYASAQLTTAAWYFKYSSAEGTDVSSVESVVALNGDRTTVAVTENQTQHTIMLGGITYAGFTMTAFHLYRNYPTVLEVVECTRSNEDLDASAACVFSTMGAGESARGDCNRYSKSEL